MIYIEIITSLLIIYLMAHLTKIVTAILIVDKQDVVNIIVERYKVNGEKRKKLSKIIENPTSFIVATKTAIGFLSMWLGAIIVELVAMPIYYKADILNVAAGYSIKYLLILATVIVLSYVTYLFTELIPKVLAIKNKQKILIKCIPDIYFLYHIFNPIFKLGNRIEKHTLKTFGVKKSYEEIISDSEIKETLEVRKEKGDISKKDKDIISNYLSIDSMVAGNIMVPLEKVEMINLTATKEKLKDKILTCGYSRLPVYCRDRQNVVGIINTKKLLELILKKEKIEIKKIMKPCMVASSGRRIDLLFNDMKTGKEHIAVIEENKEVVGIVTMEDIIEELVGDITDDYEKYKKRMS